MSEQQAGKANNYLWAALGLLGVLLLTAIFFGWIRYGTDMFLAMAERGISFCL